MLHIISLRAHFSQNVKDRYEIREVLVPIFHALCGICTKFSRVKFAKCELPVRQCTVTNKKHLTSLKAVELRSLVHYGVYRT